MRKNRPKMTSQGIDIREIERIQEQECNAIKYMQKTIKKIVYTAHNSNSKQIDRIESLRFGAHYSFSLVSFCRHTN